MGGEGRGKSRRGWRKGKEREGKKGGPCPNVHGYKGYADIHGGPLDKGHQMSA